MRNTGVCYYSLFNFKKLSFSNWRNFYGGEETFWKSYIIDVKSGNIKYTNQFYQDKILNILKNCKKKVQSINVTLKLCGYFK